MDEQGLLVITLCIGGLKLFAVLVGLALVDSVGRRPLLMLSAIGMSVGQAVTGIGYVAAAPWATIVGQCSLLAFYAVGFGSCSQMVAAEVLPSTSRAWGLAVTMLFNRATSALQVCPATSLPD